MSNKIKEELIQHGRKGLREFVRDDLRTSHLIIGGLVVVGLIVNILLPNGWTVWPFVVAAGILLTIHEAAERNGTGVPPMHVYALFFGGMIAWLAVVMLISATNPFVLIIGIAAVVYYAGKGYMHEREKAKLIFYRRKEGLCVHCGERYNPENEMCDHCGEEPDPMGTQLQRVAGVARNRANNQSVERARAALKPESTAATASRREKALIAQRQASKPNAFKRK
jgi:hypothetical protein